MTLSRALLLVVGSLVAGSAAVTALGCLPSITFDGEPSRDAAPDGDATAPPDGPAADAAEASMDAASTADADATAPVDSPSDSPLTPTFVGMGFSASCALMPDGTVQCWGSNQGSSLGAGEPPDAFTYVPQPVPGLANVTALGVGNGQSCAVVDGGVVACWGYGAEGELGTGTVSEDVPTTIMALQYEDGGTIGRVAVGPRHTCAIGADGVTVWCWGYYAGSGPTTSSDAPVYLATLDAGAVELSAGDGVTCARDVNGGVWCWGENTQGALGRVPGCPLRRTRSRPSASRWRHPPRSSRWGDPTSAS